MTLQADSALVRLSTSRRAQVQLFCFPFAGGSASLFGQWASALGPEFEVWGVEYPGHGRRFAGRASRDLDQVIDDLVPEFRHVLCPPYAMFGHSLGALASYEVQHRLEALGCPAASCFVPSGCRAPLAPAPRRLHNLPRAQFLEEVAMLGGTPALALEETELMDLILPVLRADFEMRARYRRRTRSPLRCPIVAYWGMTDSEVDKADVEKWSCETADAFRMRCFPGGHFFIQSTRASVLRALCADVLGLPS
jgi:medium-chain acyl-[acyl-carrier-protein] hydrolase